MGDSGGMPPRQFCGVPWAKTRARSLAVPLGKGDSETLLSLLGRSTVSGKGPLGGAATGTPRCRPHPRRRGRLGATREPLRPGDRFFKVRWDQFWSLLLGLRGLPIPLGPSRLPKTRGGRMRGLPRATTPRSLGSGPSRAGEVWLPLREEAFLAGAHGGPNSRRKGVGFPAAGPQLPEMWDALPQESPWMRTQ
jgi:hypothetical protein